MHLTQPEEERIMMMIMMIIFPKIFIRKFNELKRSNGNRTLARRESGYSIISPLYLIISTHTWLLSLSLIA